MNCFCGTAGCKGCFKPMGGGVPKYIRPLATDVERKVFTDFANNGQPVPVDVPMTATAEEMLRSRAAWTPACKGKNCGATDGLSHSKECFAEHERNCLGTESILPRQAPPLSYYPGLGNGVDSGDTKPSNPKDAIGSRKLDLGLVPDTAVAGMAAALTEGALKYGRYNWRICGVSAAIYHAAARRHLAKWWNGQDRDTKTLVHHIDSSMACLAIIRDALVYGKLTDDRPPSPGRDKVAAKIDKAEKKVAHIREVFKDHSPHQFTISDTPTETK